MMPRAASQAIPEFMKKTVTFPQSVKNCQLPRNARATSPDLLPIDEDFVPQFQDDERHDLLEIDEFARLHHA